MATFLKMKSQATNLMGSFAERLLRQARFPPTFEGSDSTYRVLDNACGAATVTDKIMEAVAEEHKSRVSITCADFSDFIVDAVSAHAEANGWSGVDVVKSDAQDSKLPSSSFSHIFFSFGPMILPDPFKGLEECHRMLKPGGTFGCTTWQDIGWVSEFKAALAENPNLPPLPEEFEFLKSFTERDERWDNVEDVRAHIELHGFEDVHVETASNTSYIDSIDTIRGMLPYTLDKVIEKFWTKEEANQYQKLAGDTAVEYVNKKYNGGPVVWEWAAIIATGKKQA